VRFRDSRIAARLINARKDLSGAPDEGTSSMGKQRAKEPSEAIIKATADGVSGESVRALKAKDVLQAECCAERKEMKRPFGRARALFPRANLQLVKSRLRN
jgi:hypothetical protein